ncbi:MAG: ATP-binding cassette domain-containing protein [Verrucomicrobia bacterium]|nr:ATP-binding cassette domain-containing protein [Verrucomicrobiota bacterium]
MSWHIFRRDLTHNPLHWMRWAWLQRIPGIGRLRALRPGTDAHVGVLVDAFAAFATLDDVLSSAEADMILDLLRSAFPEVDHGWLQRRLQRAVRNPRPLQGVSAELKETLNDAGKLAVGLELFTLVDASGRSERGRASFEVFMRRLGRPDYGAAILREMLGESGDEGLPFERLVFGGEGADVVLPPMAVAQGQEFRVYRTGDLVLVRNTGAAPLWIRGRSLETGSFLRVRERQPLVVPGWTLSHEDLMFFLNVKRTGNTPSIYLEAGVGGLTAERMRGRMSLVRVSFGLEAEVEVLRNTNLHAGSRGPLKRGETVVCLNHERLGEVTGVSLSINELRRRAAQSGRRFRLAGDRQEYLVSNDAAALTRGDLLLGAKLAPRAVLFIRYDAERAEGVLEVRQSEGPIQVDGQLVRGTAVLVDGSLIRLSGSQAVRCRFRECFLDEERTQIESLRVEDLIHDFAPGARALDHINFEVRRGEMLCIIGPSGSGKSTLLSVLSGQLEPSRGKVNLNGIRLYDHRERLVPFIAYMPQEEALNAQLTVREHLRHAVTMRRPALSLAEHERRVDSMLAELGLQSIARRRVGSTGEKTLSGGERSRLNLGLDLGSRAEVFLFDEPISGLSSKDSEHVAETLRSLAREKIVIASLHRPGALVLRLFDKVLLLDSGGCLAYFGTPAGMVEYFREACEELGISHPSMAGGGALGADFVFDVLETPLSVIGGGSNTGAARRFPPAFWQEKYESVALLRSLLPGAGPVSRLSDVGAVAGLPLPLKQERRVRTVLAVFATHFLRSLLSKMRNRGTIYSMFIEAPVLAALVAITLRSSPSGEYAFATALHIPAYLFLSVTVAMFLGLTNSATEVLRDRPVLRRERNCQSSAASYVAAKFVALGLVASGQCLMYMWVGNYFLEIHGMVVEHWLWLTLTAWAGTALALVVSSVVKTERAALTAVPLLLVPQMLLAGALVPYREMNRGLFEDIGINRERGGAPVPSAFMPLRYAYEGMLVAQATRNPFELERIRLQREIDAMRDRGGEMNAAQAERFELLKEGLRRLLAAGAVTAQEAADLVARIARIARFGTKLEVATMKVWPGDAAVSPASGFFVNERIDLLVREAETFRNDYRNTEYRNIFLALEKPLPFAGSKQAHPAGGTGQPVPAGAFEWEIETKKFCGLALVGLVFGCWIVASFILSYQNRRTR